MMRRESRTSDRSATYPIHSHSDDPHFQSLVNVIFPHMAADEAAEQCAVEESTKQVCNCPGTVGM